MVTGRAENQMRRLCTDAYGPGADGNDRRERTAPAYIPVQVSVMWKKILHKAGARRQEDTL